MQQRRVSNSLPKALDAVPSFQFSVFYSDGSAVKF